MSRQREARQKQAAKERRAENRKLADAARTRQRRNARARKVGLRVGAAVAVVAVVVATGLVVRQVIRDGRIGPANMISDGLLIVGDGSTTFAIPTGSIPAGGLPSPHDTQGRTQGMLDIVMYVDYGNPASAVFWEASGPVLANAVAAGGVSLEIHPLALSHRTNAVPEPTPPPGDPADPDADADPGTDEAGDDADEGDDAAEPAPTTPPAPLVATDHGYAKRAANTFACVAANVPDQALTVHDALLNAQPSVGPTGLTDSELVTLVGNVGVENKDVRSCIGAHNYVRWVNEATTRAKDLAPSPWDWRGGITVAPTIIVAGQLYSGSLSDAEAFATFVDEVYQTFAPPAEDPLPDDGAPDALPDGILPEDLEDLLNE